MSLALEKITEKAQEEISEAFYSSAQENAEASNGLLVAYRPDFIRFPYQSLSVRKDRREVVGSPLDSKRTFEVAQLVDKRCEGLEQAFIDSDESSGALSLISNVLVTGGSSILGTDHQEISDIAFFAAGNSAVLRDRGANHNSALMLSKAASDYMGVNLESFDWPLETVIGYLGSLGLQVLDDNTIPVRDFLRLAVDKQHLVIPNTGSFANLRGLQEDAVEAHNDKVKKDIFNSMSRKGLANRLPTVLYIALPGTKNKKLDVGEYWKNYQIPGYHETIPENLPTNVDDVDVIGKISSGVCDYASESLTFAATLRIGKERKPLVAIDPRAEVLNENNKILLIARKLISMVDEIDGTTTVYDVRGNLKTVKQ